MTREVKIGTAVAGSFLSLVGIVVGVKLNGDISPQNPETITQSEQVLKAPGSNNPPAPSKEPNKLVLASAFDQNPLPVQGSDVPVPPRPNNANSLPPQIPPPPNLNGFNLPAISDNEFEKTLEAQRKKAEEQRAAFGQKPNEFANAGNSSANDVKKKPDEIDNLPPPLDPNKFALAPPERTMVAADGTIANGGGKKSAAPSAPMPPLSNGNTSTPNVSDPPKGTIVGGPAATLNLPATPPNPNLPPLQKPGNDVPPPPPSGDLPVFSPPGNNLPSPGFTPSTPPAPISAPPQQPLLPTPNTPIITTKQNDSPGLPPPAFGKPQETTNAAPPPPAAIGDLPSASNPNAPSVPAFIPMPIPAPPTQFTNNLPPANAFSQPPNANFSPPVQSAPPVVKFESPQRYVVLANENYALISYRKYGTENYARALEAYNRDLPGAPPNVAANPAQLQEGTVILLPSAKTLLERDAGAAPASNLPPIPAPAANSRPLGSDIGLNPPTPGNAPPRPTTTPDTSVKSYRVPTGGMYLSQVAQTQLGSALRWIDIYRLNPGLQPEQPLTEGIIIRVPAK